MHHRLELFWLDMKNQLQKCSDYYYNLFKLWNVCVIRRTFMAVHLNLNFVSKNFIPMSGFTFIFNI